MTQTTDKTQGVKDLFIQVANIFAVISVPIGMAIGGLLMSLRSDVDVIKTQLVEQQRTRTTIEQIQLQQTNILIELEKLKSNIRIYPVNKD